MDSVIDQLRQLSANVPKLLDELGTTENEEATKNALVIPFLEILGYDPRDPAQVVPEYTADVGIKKGEKVDYALLKDGQPIILIECKWYGANLEQVHHSQLYRYFSTRNDAKFAILTNGCIYKFYTDLDTQNRMDDEPFFKFDIRDFDERTAEIVKGFCKTSFDLETLKIQAQEQKYKRSIQKFISDQFSDPAGDFIKFIAEKIYSKKGCRTKITARLRQQFTELTKQALHQFINDKIDEQWWKKSAEAENVKTQSQGLLTKLGQAAITPDQTHDTAIPNIEELQAYYIVKAILWQSLDNPDRLVQHKFKGNYMGILLDGNQQKPVCKLWFTNSEKYLAICDGIHKESVKEQVTSLNDIFKFAERLKTAMANYEPNKELIEISD